MKYIGDELRERMNMLNIDCSILSKESFLDEEVIRKLIANELAYEEIDDFDLDLLCNSLHCDTRYFIDNDVKERDLVFSTMNRGEDTLESKKVKAKIQDFLNDYNFLRNILLED